MFKIFPASIRPNINWHFSLLTSQDLASNNNEELLKMEFYEKKKMYQILWWSALSRKTTICNGTINAGGIRAKVDVIMRDFFH